MRKNEKFFAAFLVLSSGLFYSVREVRADIPVFPFGFGIEILVAAGIIVLIIAVWSFMHLRRIRKSSQKDADN